MTIEIQFLDEATFERAKECPDFIRTSMLTGVLVGQLEDGATVVESVLITLSPPEISCKVALKAIDTFRRKHRRSYK